MLCGGQAGEGFGDKFVVDLQVVPVGREHSALAEIVVQGAELVQLRLGDCVHRGLTLSLALQVPQVVPGLVAQDGLAESIEPAPRVLIAGDDFHLLTPFHRGMEWLLSLSATKTPASRSFAQV